MHFFLRIHLIGTYCYLNHIDIIILTHPTSPHNIYIYIDDDCDEGLTCFQRDGQTAVPGCAAEGEGKNNVDYCIAG